MNENEARAWAGKGIFNSECQLPHSEAIQVLVTALDEARTKLVKVSEELSYAWKHEREATEKLNDVLGTNQVVCAERDRVRANVRYLEAELVKANGERDRQCRLADAREKDLNNLTKTLRKERKSHAETPWQERAIKFCDATCKGGPRGWVSWRIMGNDRHEIADCTICQQRAARIYAEVVRYARKNPEPAKAELEPRPMSPLSTPPKTFDDLPAHLRPENLADRVSRLEVELHEHIDLTREDETK